MFKIGVYEVPIQLTRNKLIELGLELDKITNLIENIPEEYLKELIPDLIMLTKKIEILEYLFNKKLSIRIAYLGPEGSFTHEALIKSGIRGYYVTKRSISEIFQSVINDDVNFGFIPFENNLEGIIHETLDCLFEYSSVYVNQCFEMKINQCLIVNPKIDNLSEIEVLYTHPIALRQCQKFVKYLQSKGIKIVLTNSTSEALEQVINNDKACAIASKFGALSHNLKILIENIEDYPSYTKFILISKTLRRTGSRTSLIFTLDHKPGTLFKFLELFARSGINLTMIYSRPLKYKPWDYYFYLEFEKSLEELSEDFVKEIECRSLSFRFLGSYDVVKI